MQVVADIMTADVASVSPQENIRRVAEMMKELDVGSIPVCDGDRVIGMVTDRDIAIRTVAEGESPEQVQVKDIMSVNVITCFDNQPVDEMMEEMRDEQVRRIPVLDHQTHRLVGIVSLGDLATKHSAEVDRTLYEISTPAEPDSKQCPCGPSARRFACLHQLPCNESVFFFRYQLVGRKRRYSCRRVPAVEP